MAIRRTKKGVRTSRAGVAYREEYPLTGYSKGRLGRVQYYRRDPQSGRFDRIPEHQLPEVDASGIRKLYPEAGGTYVHKRDWWRDIQLIGTLGVIIITAMVSYVVLNGFFDYMIDIEFVNSLGFSLENIRTEATLLLTVVIGLIVGGGMSLFLFRQNELDDSVYLEVEE